MINDDEKICDGCANLGQDCTCDNGTCAECNEDPCECEEK